MAKPFRRTRHGVRVQLDPHERALLGRLLTDVEEMLAGDAAEREQGEEGAAPGPSGEATARAAAGSDDDVLAALEAQLTTPPPNDPAVARLLPDGHRDDPDLAAGYRRLHEHSLRERKMAGLGRAAAALARSEPVVLDAVEAGALLKGMTDVRLVVAERLGLKTDEDAEALHRLLARAADWNDPRTAAAALYDALTWWQESLIGELR